MNSAHPRNPDSDWLFVCGESDPELAKSLADRVASLRSEKGFTESDQAEIQALSFAVTREGFSTTPERMQQIQRLCQLFSMNARPTNPTSHRPVIGPIIVGVKKILFPLVNALFGPTFRIQREFNSLVLALLTDLCNEEKRPTPRR